MKDITVVGNDIIRTCYHEAIRSEHRNERVNREEGKPSSHLGDRMKANDRSPSHSTTLAPWEDTRPQHLPQMIGTTPFLLALLPIVALSPVQPLA